jgi:hypothetical protein
MGLQIATSEERVIKSTHKALLQGVRGQGKSPGQDCKEIGTNGNSMIVTKDLGMTGFYQCRLAGFSEYGSNGRKI